MRTGKETEIKKKREGKKLEADTDLTNFSREEDRQTDTFFFSISGQSENFMKETVVCLALAPHSGTKL